MPARKVTFRSVDEYIESFGDDVRPILTRVRNAIREALPQSEECISYNMPTYKLRGRALLHFAGWKSHYSLYAATAAVVAAFKADLRPYKIEKGTVQFPYTKPVPVDLIRKIAKARADEIAGQSG